MHHLHRPFALIATAALVFGACGADDEEVTQARAFDDNASETSEPASDASDAQEADDDDGHGHSEHTGPDAGTSEAPQTAGDEPTADGEVAVVEVEMNEFAYEPSELTVPAGETVRFVFTNTGDIEHEAMIGTPHEQEEFESDGHGGHGESHHGEVAAITLAPGETGELQVTFDEPAELLLGCHLPGHWDAGMKATLTVS